MSGRGDEGWEELLAERVRALSGDRPSAPAPISPGGASSPDLEEARRFLEFAFRRKEPTIAAGSRFEGIKRAILRAARIFTRPQAEFNAASVETMERLAREAAAARGERHALRDELGSTRDELAARVDDGARAARREVDAMRSAIGVDLDRLRAAGEESKGELRSRLSAMGETLAAAERERAAGRAELVDALGRIESALQAEQRARGEVSEHLGRVESALAREQAARDELSGLLTAALPRVDALEALRASLPALESIRLEVERLRAAQAIDRVRVEELASQRVAGTGAVSAPPRAPSLPLPPTAYFEFEDRFRGPEDEIRARQEVYLPFFRSLDAVAAGRGPVMDAGCGRGEFLELLAREGIPAIGVDSNAAMAARCREKGLAVEAGDLFEALRARPDKSLSGFFAAQVVEHLEMAVLRDLLQLARAKVAAGGGLVLETINPESVFAMKFFWTDPTHVRPVPAPTLEVLARAAGFADAEIRFLSPVAADQRLETRGDPNLERLDRAIFGFQDYALLARVVE